MYLIAQMALLPLALLAAGFTTAAQAQAGSSFKCSPKMSSSAETLVCKSDELSTLDRKLATAYNAAIKKAGSRTNTSSRVGSGGLPAI
jgi:uncharacterized protein